MMCLIHTHTVGQAHSASVKPTFDVGPALAQVYPILFHGLWCAPAHELLSANLLGWALKLGRLASAIQEVEEGLERLKNTSSLDVLPGAPTGFRRENLARMC
ncbi:MAG TPA: hypothetical protein VEL69_06155, partial [Ktedonobacteraceae bacterium]|nr:hypothetical protein [Ktedonobacteraceae bacterium]